MRVVVAPDSFGGTLTAVEAAAAITAGWRESAPYDDVVPVPLSDGGPGFVDVLHRALGGELVGCVVSDPLGRPVDAHVLVVDGTAYVESAQACGLHLLRPEERDPRRATTRGVGTLLRCAVGAGAGRIVVGLGGSATNDGGRGMWEELRGALAPGVAVVAATDVENPLLGPNGASAVFGPQKGADRAAVLDLDDRLREWAGVVEAEVGRPGLRDAPGAGAAGGLGFALLALGATRASGVDLVTTAVDLAARVAESDVVVTGEGSFDHQSLRGKVPVGVATLALAAGVPCLVVAGRVAVGRREVAAAGIAETYAVSDLYPSADAALAAGADGVRAAAARAARAWGGRS